MRIMVTGGSGFIGSALIRHLLGTTRHDIINLDKLTAAANPRSLAGMAQEPRYQFKQLDICNAAALTTQLNRNQPDILIHLAAELDPPQATAMPRQVIQTNYLGTFTLLDCLVDYWQALPVHKRQRFRLIYLSSSDSGHPPFSSPCRTTQKGATDLIQCWHQIHGLPAMLVASPPIFGPGQFPDHLIPKTLLQAMQQQTLDIPQPDPDQPWLYLEDLITGLLAVLQHGLCGQHYSLTPADSTSQQRLTCKLCDLLDELHPAETSYRNLITFAQKDTEGFCHPNPVSRLNNPPPHWTARHSLQDGLKKTLQWYLCNPEWVHSITTGQYRQRRTSRQRLIR